MPHQTAPSSTSGPHWPRTLRRFAVSLLAAALAYLVLANIALNTGLAEHWINRKPARFTIHWQRAFTWWPGQVSVSQLTLAGHAGRHVWHIDADHAKGRFALLPLLRKELHFTRIKGSGPTAIDIDHAEHALPRPEPKPDAMRLVFDDVNLDGPLQFSFRSLSLTGMAKAHGGWKQQLRGGPFELSPSRLQLADTNLLLDGHLLVDSGNATVSASIAEHLRRDAPGLAILDHLSARLDLEGATPGLLLDVAADADLHPQILDSRGHAQAVIELAAGRLQPATHITATVPMGARIEDGPQTFGDANLDLSAGQDITLKLQLPPVEGLLQEVAVDLRFSGNALPLPPLAKHMQRASGTAKMRARFDSLTWVQPLLSQLSGIALAGKGTMDANLVIEQGRIAKGTRVDVEQAQFELSAYGHHFSGQVRGVAQTTGQDGETSADFMFDRYEVAPLDTLDKPLGNGRDLRLALGFSGTLEQMRDRLHARLRFTDAKIPDLTRFTRYQHAGGMKILSGSGTISADMRTYVQGERSEGSFIVAARNAGLRIGELAVRTDLKLDAKLQGGKLGGTAFSADGSTLKLSNTRILEPASEHTTPWSADIRIERGHADLGQPLRIDGNAKMDMQDAGFLLALYATRKSMPKWIGRIINAGRINLATRVRLIDRELVLEDFDVANQRFDLQGRLRLSENKPDGHLYANWGVLGLGLELRQGERDFHFIKPRQWYESQQPFLPSQGAKP